MFPIKRHFMFVSIHPKVYSPLNPCVNIQWGWNLQTAFYFIISDYKRQSSSFGASTLLEEKELKRRVGFCQSFYILNFLGLPSWEHYISFYKLT